MRSMSSVSTEVDEAPYWPELGDSGVWRWSPQFEISEYHWLNCAMVIPQHAQCGVCGKRLLDE